MGKTATIGIEGLLVYPKEGTTYGPGLRNKGSRSFTREVAQEITNFFADNQVYDSQAGVKTVSGEFATYHIEDEIYTSYLGFIKEANGGFADGNPEVKNAAFAFVTKFKNVETKKRQYKIGLVYNNTMTEPAIEQVTTEDAVEYTELVVPYVGSADPDVRNSKGENVSYFFMVVPYGYTLEQVMETLEQELPTPLGVNLFPVLDTTPPELTSTSTSITDWTTADDGTKTFGNIITECGIAAIDEVDGNVTSNIKFEVNGTEHASSEFIDISTVGTTTVNVKVSDSSENAAIPLVITINITA